MWKDLDEVRKAHESTGGHAEAIMALRRRGELQRELVDLEGEAEDARSNLEEAIAVRMEQIEAETQEAQTRLSKLRSQVKAKESELTELEGHVREEAREAGQIAREEERARLGRLRTQAGELGSTIRNLEARKAELEVELQKRIAGRGDGFYWQASPGELLEHFAGWTEDSEERVNLAASVMLHRGELPKSVGDALHLTNARIDSVLRGDADKGSPLEQIRAAMGPRPEQYMPPGEPRAPREAGLPRLPPGPERDARIRADAPSRSKRDLARRWHVSRREVDRVLAEQSRSETSPSA